ncbi:conserved hypothetical protein [Xanthomonas campestris pv. raphani 756C]|nr:conserved hypothetical protein [Xanthomonas campestris pv. raphani 756C]
MLAHLDVTKLPLDCSRNVLLLRAQTGLGMLQRLEKFSSHMLFIYLSFDGFR